MLGDASYFSCEQTSAFCSRQKEASLRSVVPPHAATKGSKTMKLCVALELRALGRTLERCVERCVGGRLLG